MTRRFARAARGRRAPGAAPFGGWRRLTLLGALAADGPLAAMSVEAPTSTPVFLAFVREVLVPELRRRGPGTVVVMDNLRPHKAAAVRAELEAAGAELLYLPRYSPDLSPIEHCWSKVKTRLRGSAARAKEALEEGLGPALEAITAQDARGWFAHCGYSTNPNS
jgi:transposase